MHDSLFQSNVREFFNPVRKVNKIPYRSVANVTQQIKITGDINFRNILKVWRNSRHFPKIYRLLNLYIENGILEYIFKDMHQNSYR